ncbi:MAG TPA: hypothetical protein VEH84_14495 [Alphaproteobacteria bacterium]|nr:hypothetical protein [Alphaproteobacteria bacterium]
MILVAMQCLDRSFLRGMLRMMAWALLACVALLAAPRVDWAEVLIWLGAGAAALAFGFWLYMLREDMPPMEPVAAAPPTPGPAQPDDVAKLRTVRAMAAARRGEGHPMVVDLDRRIRERTGSAP